MQQEELSVPDAARLLNVTQTTVWNMIRRGDLEVRYEWRGLQRRAYVTRASIAAWQERQRTEESDGKPMEGP